MATTMDSVTREQIEQLAREAGEAGDSEQVRLCRLVLEGWSIHQSGPTHGAHAALRACVRAIQSAEAMVDA